MERVDYDELPLAPEQKILYRSKFIDNFAGSVLSTEYMLRAGDDYIKVVG